MLNFSSTEWPEAAKDLSDRASDLVRLIGRERYLVELLGDYQERERPVFVTMGAHNDKLIGEVALTFDEALPVVTAALQRQIETVRREIQTASAKLADRLG
jgi:hypothetical protein